MEANNPYAAPTTEVRDIAPPGESQQLAGRGARLGASILDGLIASLLVYLPIIVLAGMDGLVGEDNSLNYGIFMQGAGAGGLVGLLLLIGINLYLVHRNGQTIGKRIVGIKVVRADGSRGPWAAYSGCATCRGGWSA